MFSKPISLALVYILTVFNFLVLILPFLIAVIPFVDIGSDDAVSINFLFQKIVIDPKVLFLSLIFMISFLMMCYLIMDYIFGFSVRSSLKGCKPINKIKDYNFLQGVFEEVRNKFSGHNAKLYIKDTSEINAFAVGGFGRGAIILTSGLINHYINNIEDDQKFLIAIRSILGHEMSHLINKDYLPGLLIITNTRVTNFVSGIFLWVFRVIMRLMSYATIENRIALLVITFIYNASSCVINFFNRYFVNGFYNFFKNFLGRQIEYRSDRQSAKAFGGMNMAFALSFLGKSGYFTLFSTHPATIRRIKKVEIVEEKNAVVGASALSQISNFFSIIILPIICFYIAYISKINLVIGPYIYNYYPKIHYWFAHYWPYVKSYL
jgi:Zn-dependent protease with chaperone function